MKEFIRKCSHQMLLLGCFVVVFFWGGGCFTETLEESL